VELLAGGLAQAAGSLFAVMKGRRECRAPYILTDGSAANGVLNLSTTKVGKVGEGVSLRISSFRSLW
jgi:hypothetical protein